MPATTVDLELHSTPVSLGSATVGDDGTFSKSVTIPAGFESGAHTIQVSGTNSDGDATSASVSITVTAAVTTTTVARGSGSLPFTGSSLLPLLVVGVSAIAAGLALRRRRRIV